MSDEIRDPTSEDRRLEEALAEYLLAEEQGRRPGRDSFLRRYPALADRLRAFLDNKDRLERIAGVRDLVATGAEATPPPAAPLTAALLTSSEPAAVPGYELLGELGRGGMGVVYKARHLRLDRVVALKMILAGGHAAKEILDRFQGEAEAVARLQHPNIVQIHEVGEHDGLPFFSLEFCPGGNLDRKLAGTPLPPRDAAWLVEVLARAMHAAHAVGIVHRDLKPANVLLAVVSDGPVEQWMPKVTDFGLAKRLDQVGQTGSNTILGTPSYMAPEQAGGSKTIGPPADVYALGAILYECLTGRPPFRADTPLDTLVQVVGDEPVPPRQLNPKVPRDLETICLKCLAKDPRKRYTTAAALADDLRRFRAGEPIQARPVGRLERGWRWCRRNPVVAGLLGLVAVLLVAGTTVSTLFAVAAAEQTEVAEDSARKAGEAEGQAKGEAEAARRAERRAREAEREARQRAYDSDLLLTQAAWEQNKVGRVLQLLEQQRPRRAGEEDLRGFEWYYWASQLHRGHVTLKGYTLAVTSMGFSADGKRIVSGSGDRTVKVWDVQTGQVTLTLKGHAGPVLSVALSADGKRIVSGSGDVSGSKGEVKIWDAQSGQETLTLKGHTGPVRSVAISADGTRIVSGSSYPENTVKVWDAHTGQEIRTLKGHTLGVTNVAFSPNGKRIVSGGADQTVKVWDAQTGQEQLTLKGHTNSVESVAFSSDGQRIVSGSMGFDRKTFKTWGEVKVWDAQTGQETFTLKRQRKK